MTPQDPSLDPLHTHIAYFGSAVLAAYLAAVLTSTPVERPRAPATVGGAATLSSGAVGKDATPVPNCTADEASAAAVLPPQDERIGCPVGMPLTEVSLAE